MIENSDAVITTVDDSIAIVRLNRPQQRNSLSTDALEQMAKALAEVTAEPGVKTIIFTGTGDVFSAGADLKELTQLNPASAIRFSRLGQSVFQKIAEAPQLTIAAINGYCMGGGFDFALACHVRVASPAATFSHPGARRGIITGWGGTRRLPRLIGRTKALELFITAEKYSSDEALRMGLISAVGDPVIDCAIEFANAARADVTLS